MNNIQIGDISPDFTLKSQTGAAITLSNFIGKKNIVLYFYPKDETRGCTAQACSFRDNYEIFKELGAEVIGVSSDNMDSHQKFSKHHQLPFILLSDIDKKVRNMYGVSSTLRLIPGRVTFIIDKKGIIQHIFSSQFRPRKHITEAIEVLKTLD